MWIHPRPGIEPMSSALAGGFFPLDHQWSPAVSIFYCQERSFLSVAYIDLIKRRLLLGRKVMTNLDSVLKSRGITLPTKIRLVKAMVFPVVRYGCESWAIRKVERWRTHDFKLWCWRRLLRVPWTARRLNQSVLKKINTRYSLEGLLLKLKLQYFGHLMWRAVLLKRS